MVDTTNDRGSFTLAKIKGAMNDSLGKQGFYQSLAEEVRAGWHPV